MQLSNLHPANGFDIAINRLTGVVQIINLGARRADVGRGHGKTCKMDGLDDLALQLFDALVIAIAEVGFGANNV